MNFLLFCIQTNILAISLNADAFYSIGIQSLLAAYSCSGLLLIAFRSYQLPRLIKHRTFQR